MTGASRSERLGGSWRRLGVEQRVAAIGAFLLAFSTLGPFSFVEAAQLLVCFALLALLKARADGRRFHLPFGDGTIVMVAGLWSAGLIVVRLFDRPLGQGLLALVCAAIVAGAGLRERSQRPMDDIAVSASEPLAARPPTKRGGGDTGEWPAPDLARTRPVLPEDDPTERLSTEGDDPTVALEPDDPSTERLDGGEDPTTNLPPEPPLPR